MLTLRRKKQRHRLNWTAESRGRSQESRRRSGNRWTAQGKQNHKICRRISGHSRLIALAAGGGFYFYRQQMQKKKAEKEALDPDADYTEDKGDFEIPTDVPDEDEAPDEQDTEPI